jgi:hypothetical protein
MRLIIEEVDGAIYGDLILTEDEGIHLGQGALLETMAIIKHKRYYIGVRVGDKWRYTPPAEFIDEPLAE